MAYNQTQIRALLERYFDGETSVAEERTLREYFAACPDLPPDMEYARTMLGYFAEAAEGRCSVSPALKAAAPHKRRRKIVAWAGSAAAAVAAGLILTFNLVGSKEVVYCYINGEPVTDYDLAYAYTQGALGIIVDNVRKPQEHLIPIEELERSLESLRYLELLGFFTDETDNQR